MAELDINRDPSDAEIEELRDALIAYNVGKHGYSDVSKVAILVRNEAGSLEAGVYAYAWGGCCQVELLWVDERRRGEGLGTRLMAAVEEEARRIGCSLLFLDTFSYQAPGFYEKLGFEMTGTVPEFPEGHTYYVFAKRLSSQ